MPAMQTVPEGYHSVTPYLCVKSADKAIQFYEQAFGAREVMRLTTPDGGIAHAELQIGNSRVMLSDENPVYGNRSVETMGGSPAAFMFYMDDADAMFDRAVKAGATVKKPMTDQFYGDRTGTVIDPFGYQWSIGMHVEDVSSEEMQQRMQKMFSAAPA